jgi:short-subunit dehydrogenase
VLGFTASLQGDLEDAGVPIRVHAVCPDGVDTRMVRDRMDDPESAIIFSGGTKLIQPAELAEKIVALLDSTAIVLAIPRSRAGISRMAMRYPRAGLRTLSYFKKVGERNKRKVLQS